MRNSSLAAQAVAQGPMTAAPPSFEQAGWLFVLNLSFFTAGFYLLLMFLGWQVSHVWRNRRRDCLRDPVTLWRLSLLLLVGGFWMRCGAEAHALWSWDPHDPLHTAFGLRVKRFVDPIAALMGFAGIALSVVSARGMVHQLRRRPFPIDMWASLPMLKRPAVVVLVTLIMSIGVVSLR